jgi:hypothetical protein
MSRRQEAIDLVLRLLRAYPSAHVSITDPATGARTEVHLPAEPAPISDGSCNSDILTTLREAGQRLTTTQLIAAMEAAGRPWAESTIKAALAAMVRDGTLLNRPDGKPKGYEVAGSGTP